MTVESPTAAPGRRKRRRGVVTEYDFTRPTALAREHSRALEVSFEAFARQFSTTLLTRLRQTCTVVSTGVGARSFEDHLALQPPLGVFLTFRTEAGGATGLVALTTTTVMTALDFLLGGHGDVEGVVVEGVERELSDIDSRLVESLSARLLADLASAFAGVVPMAPVLADVDQSSQFLTMAAPADVVLVADFTVALGEEAEALPFSVMLPLNPVLARLVETRGTAESSEEQRRTAESAADVLSRTVPELPVDVCARMTPMALSVQAVTALSVGDVLHLPHPTARPLDVVTNDVVLTRAVPGTSGTRLACLVVNPDEETR
ncbi:flagellar motor switch protein FliM [Quadrisphaera sp. INWT6]|uniref:flagellar motor switch protein FliM n=1 Tax=Quadrisphaera sp. INWT6 TaxID=2596917 RepID=UPI00189222F8|nr:FliM/FliN family flagellar motor switch protein [Quadrisphaera sp. INWT6]MBF5083116.1 flagellar motor switch protein FliM [Quadrisphaera sp. INWT6]